MDINQFKFGVEVELYNIKRSDVANCIISVLGNQYKIIEYQSRRGKCYYIDTENGTWRCKCDSSLHNDANAKKPYSQENTCELVTPILTLTDLDTFLDIIKLVIKAGGKSDYNHGCMIHVHVDEKLFSIEELINVLVYHNVLYSDIAKKLNFTKDQIDDRIKNLSDRFIDHIQIKTINSLKDIEPIWYRYMYDNQKQKPYNKSRYSIVNLHSIFYNKTGVEFRYFKLDKLTLENMKAIIIFLVNFILFSSHANMFYRRLEDIIPKLNISKEDKRIIYQLFNISE